MKENSSTKKLLLVEDDVAVRNNLQLGLTELGYSVDEVESGLEALNIIEKSYQEKMPYDVLVSNLELPDITGKKLLEIIRCKHLELPVVTIAAFANKTNPQDIYDCGGDGHIKRPFSPKELHELIERGPKISIRTRLKKTKSRDLTKESYIFLKFLEGAEFVDIYKDLYAEKDVLRCDAVRDVYDMIILLNESDDKKIAKFIETKLKPKKQIIDIQTMKIKSPELGSELEDVISSYQTAYGRETQRIEECPDDQVSSYLFLEVERNMLEEIYPKLYFLDEVVAIDVTMDKYDLVMRIRDKDFDKISDVIHEKIWQIDGVLRARKINIIEMFGI